MTAQTSLPKRILLFGATGVIGKCIFNELYAARASFEKIGIFTSPNTVANKPDRVELWKEQGVEVIVGDVNSEANVAKAYEDYDAVISALGRNAILSQIPLIKVAEASNTIKFFYPSEYGTDIEYGPVSATEKPHQLKLQVREYIRAKTRKLKVTYLVTGPYSDLFFAPASKYEYVGNFDPKQRKATLLGTGNEEISFASMKDVGRLLVAALQTPTTLRERILKVNSFTTTGKKALAEFEKQTGTQWEVKYTALEDLERFEQEAWEKGDPLATVFTLRRIWTQGGTLYAHRDNGKIGFEGKEETLEEQIAKSIEKHS